MIPTTEYAQFYAGYVKNSEKYTSILEGLLENNSAINDLKTKIDARNQDYRYAQGKWSIKELILHLADTERILSTRALRIGRGDKTQLTGFDHDKFVNQSNASRRSIENIFQELDSVRVSTINLFKSFNEEDLKLLGNANGYNVSLRALGYIIIGHTMHHLNVIAERYL